MMYNGHLSPNGHSSPSIDYSDHKSTRRCNVVILCVVATILLALSVTALIIVFAVEHSWFSDSYVHNSTTDQTFTNQSYTNQYGLWRLCFSVNRTCDSWFTGDAMNSYYVEQRLNKSKIGINAWQALEIVFLFLTFSAFVIAVISLISYPLWKNMHYYLAILTTFCVWPAACTGIAGLFVFGFSVYNVSMTPHNLDWCFWVNLVAVILSVIAAIILTIYDISLKMPAKKSVPNETVIASFADFQDFPAPSNVSTFVIAPRQQQGKREKLYAYPHTENQQNYFPTEMSRQSATDPDFIVNTNHQMMPPFSLGSSYQQSTTREQPPVGMPYRAIDYNFPDVSRSRSGASMSPPPSSQTPPYQIHSSATDWRRNETNSMMRNNPEAVNDYARRGVYRPARLEPIQHNSEQRPTMHHQTSSDGFNAFDPSGIIPTRNYLPPMGSGSPMRYTANPYRQ